MSFLPFLPPNVGGYPKGARLLGPAQPRAHLRPVAGGGDAADRARSRSTTLFARFGVFDVSDSRARSSRTSATPAAASRSPSPHRSTRSYERPRPRPPTPRPASAAAGSSPASAWRPARRSPPGYGLAVWANGDSSTTSSTRRTCDHRAHARRAATTARSSWSSSAAATTGSPPSCRWPTPPIRALRPTLGVTERDRARRRRRPAPEAGQARGALPGRAGRDRRRRRLPRPEPLALRVARVLVGGRRRGRAATSAGSAATSTAPSGSTTRSPRSASGRCRRPRCSATSSFATSITDATGLQPRLPAWADTPDDLVAAWSKFAPASPDPATLLGQVQQAIHLTVKARAGSRRRPRGRRRRRDRSERRPRCRAGRGNYRRSASVADSLRLAAQLVAVEAPAAGDLRERPRRLRHPPGAGATASRRSWPTSTTASTRSSRRSTSRRPVTARARDDGVGVRSAARSRTASGTDHGTAAPHFFIGPGVKGGRYGAAAVAHRARRARQPRAHRRLPLDVRHRAAGLARRRRRRHRRQRLRPTPAPRVTPTTNRRHQTST